MKHVILGAGPAGVIAAETLRKHKPLDEITLATIRDDISIFINAKG